MSLDRHIRHIIVCPLCKGPLEHRETETEELLCPACELAYPVENDIPCMLPELARRCS